MVQEELDDTSKHGMNDGKSVEVGVGRKIQRGNRTHKKRLEGSITSKLTDRPMDMKKTDNRKRGKVAKAARRRNRV